MAYDFFCSYLSNNNIINGHIYSPLIDITNLDDYTFSNFKDEFNNKYWLLFVEKEKSKGLNLNAYLVSKMQSWLSKIVYIDKTGDESQLDKIWNFNLSKYSDSLIYEIFKKLLFTNSKESDEFFLAFEDRTTNRMGRDISEKFYNDLDYNTFTQKDYIKKILKFMIKYHMEFHIYLPQLFPKKDDYWDLLQYSKNIITWLPEYLDSSYNELDWYDLKLLFTNENNPKLEYSNRADEYDFWILTTI